MEENISFLAQTDRMDTETFNIITMTKDLGQMVHLGAEMTADETLAHFKSVGMPDEEAQKILAGAKAGAFEANYGRIKIKMQPRESGGFAFQFQDNFTGETYEPKYTEETDRGKARKLGVSHAQDILAGKK